MFAQSEIFFSAPHFLFCPPKKIFKWGGGSPPKNLILYKLQGCNKDLKSAGAECLIFFRPPLFYSRPPKIKNKTRDLCGLNFDRGGGGVGKRFLFDTFWGDAGGSGPQILGGLCRPHFETGGAADPLPPRLLHPWNIACGAM